MDIHKVIDDIERIDDRADRCIAYCEVIVYLNTIKQTINFHPTNNPWKHHINEQVVKLVHKDIDDTIENCTHLMKFNAKDI